jgi:phosphoesterase RecJ-like protein
MSEVSDILREQNGFLIVTHVNPDGDAVGSLLGMYNALKESGKTVAALTRETLPEMYSFLPGFEEVVISPQQLTFTPLYIVSLDVAERGRIYADLDSFPNVPIINIDHHPTNPEFGTINLVDSGASATSEIVFGLLKSAEINISSDTAKCLYTGLVTDTGCFRFKGVTSKTFQIASEMLSSGIDSYEVTRFLFEEYPPVRLKLEKLVLERMEEFFEGRLVFSTIYESDIAKLGASMADSENLVNRLREGKGTQVGVLFTCMNDGLTRVSLRSKDIDVSVIAKELGGGGHANASGIKSNSNLQMLKTQILERVKTSLERLGM